MIDNQWRMLRLLKPNDYFAGANLNIATYVPLTSARILEIGCAGGILGEWLRHERRCEYWGIELDAAAATRAADRLDRVICADVESLVELPLPLDYFDCVIFGDVLEHLLDPEGLLRRLRPHLTVDSTLVTNVPNIGHWSVVIEQLRGDFPYADSGLLDRTHRTFFTPKTLREMLWRSGFIVRESNPYHVTSEVVGVLASAAATLGLDPAVADETLRTYQFLVRADSQPCPERQPAKKAILTRSKVALDDAVVGKTSVIIVTFNSATTIEDCIFSLIRTIDEEDEIIVLDNGSSDQTVELVRRMAKRDSTITLIENHENAGFSKANNIGIVHSRGEFFVLANPDTVFYMGWLESFKSLLGDPACGAVGPLSDAVAGAQQIVRKVPNWSELSVEAIAATVRSHHKGEYEESKLLIGFCLGIRRNVLSDVGLLDEELFLGAEDLELSWRLRCLGYRLAIALDVFVHHRHHVSFDSIGESESSRLIRASDVALKKKLTEYYEDLTGITSTDIWGIGIFDAVLDSNE